MDDLYILLTPFWQMTVQCLVCRSVRHCLGSGSWGTCLLLKVMESLMQQLWKSRFSLVVVVAGGFVLVPLRPLWWWRNLSSWEVTLKVSCKSFPKIIGDDIIALLYKHLLLPGRVLIQFRKNVPICNLAIFGSVCSFQIKRTWLLRVVRLPYNF